MEINAKGRDSRYYDKYKARGFNWFPEEEGLGTSKT